METSQGIKDKLTKLDFYIYKLFDSFKDGMPNKNVFTPIEFTDAYTQSYNICTSNSHENDSSKIIYDFYNLKIIKYLDFIYNKLLKSNDLIIDIIYELEKFKVINKWLSKFFQYLDRYYVIMNNLPNLEQNGMNKFYQGIFLKLLEKNEYNELLFKHIDIYRIQKNTENLSNIKTFINLIKNDSEIYNLFHNRLINHTLNFYKKILSDYFEDYNLYLDNLTKIIEFENYNSFDLLAVTQTSLLNTLYQNLLYNNFKNILFNEKLNFDNLLKDNNYNKIQQIYLLYKYNNEILTVLSEHYMKHLDKILLDKIIIYDKSIKKDYCNLFNDLINIYSDNQSKINNHLESNQIFQAKFIKSFSNIMLSKFDTKFIDYYLVLAINKNLINKNIAYLELNSKIEKLLLLFNVIVNKDLFIENHQIYLSDRLLNKNYNDIELEKKIISKLKLECGYSAVGKLERMISDFILIDDNIEKFNEYIDSKNLFLPVKMNVKVLTFGNWPKFRDEKLILPNDMIKNQNIFNSYYEEKFSSRKILWHYQNDSLEISAIFNSNKYNILCNIYQALVLLLFNDNIKLKKEEIIIKTGINDEIVNKILHSLCLPKHKLLNLSNNYFEINNNFSNNLKKIKLLCPSLKSESPNKNVDVDRSLIIESNIVRIMKSRKVLSHNDLINEIMLHIKNFIPEISMIKNRIESLIERDYLERNNISTYKYLA